jgi:hypothetical protein
MLPPRRRHVALAGSWNGTCRNHLQWIRGFTCIVPHCDTGAKVQAHHVRKGIPVEAERGGTGMTPHDKWTVPICAIHHEQAHHGQDSFERKYGLDLIAKATEFAAASPALRRLRTRQKENA